MAPARLTQGLVYRRGSRSATNFTPRAGVDTRGRRGQAAGLSTFEPFELGSGEKAQVIDLGLLPSSLQAFADDPGEGGTAGHVSIVPVDAGGNIDQTLLDEWAAARETGQTHPLTAAVQEAVIEVRTRRKS
jgi:hypothetical protein